MIGGLIGPWSKGKEAMPPASAGGIEKPEGEGPGGATGGIIGGIAAAACC